MAVDGEYLVPLMHVSWWALLAKLMSHMRMRREGGMITGVNFLRPAQWLGLVSREYVIALVRYLMSSV